MKADYAASVFINCPFDAPYRPMLFAAAFAILDCGYQPRCAQQMEDGGEIRVEKIKRIIAECKFGLHDISEVGLGANGLPRFNMPYELGLFLGARQYGDKHQRSKITLIVDREPYRYQEFLSDIAGQDIRHHGGDPLNLVRVIRNWLANATERETIPGAPVIQQHYREFMAQLPDICAGMQLVEADLLFNEYTQFASMWLRLREEALEPAR